jgi:hypothetical protein
VVNAVALGLGFHEPKFGFSLHAVSIR